MSAPLGYPDAVWAHFLATPRAGRLAPGTDGVRAAEASTPAGDARLRLECRIANGRIEDARFQAYGCPYTIATGAWLAGWCAGRDLADASRLTAADVAAALEIPEDRAHCCLMAQDLVRAAIVQDP